MDNFQERRALYHYGRDNNADGHWRITEWSTPAPLDFHISLTSGGQFWVMDGPRWTVETRRRKMRAVQISPATDRIQSVCAGRDMIHSAHLALSQILPSGWSVETVDSCDDQSSLVVMSPGQASTTYLVTQALTGLEVEELKDDTLKVIDTCRSVGQLSWLLDARIRLVKTYSS